MAACLPTDALKPVNCHNASDSDLHQLLTPGGQSSSIDRVLSPNQTGSSKGGSCSVDLTKRLKSRSFTSQQSRRTGTTAGTVDGIVNAVDCEAHGRNTADKRSAGEADSKAASTPRSRSLRPAATAASSSPVQYAIDFRCDVCDRVCSSEAKLRLHAAVHSKPYECPKCSRRFSFKNLLALHMRRHEGKLPLSSSACDVCGKRFSSESYLRMHVKTHAGERPHACDVCGQRFRYRFYVRQHMMLHTGERPYKCDVCGQCFTQSSHLRTHLLHHSGVKPHECRVCGRRFRQTSHLNRHMILHSGERPHVCQVCGRRFTHLANVRQHMLQHSGERPYACSVCGHRVTCSSALRSHEVTHTGVRPYACDLCDRAFVFYWRLRRHREAEHPAEHAAEEAEARRRERGSSPLPAKAKVAAAGTGDRRDKCRHACHRCGQRFGSKGALTRHDEIEHVPGQQLPREQQALLEQLSREQWTALVKLASNSRRQPYVRLVDCMKAPKSGPKSS